MAHNAIIAVDPGREKCGVAVVLQTGDAPDRRVVPLAELAATVSSLASRFGVRRVVLGAGTHHAEVMAHIRTATGVEEIVEVDEAFSTREARDLYWRIQPPPRGVRRLIPRSLLVPPEPYDDLTAWILGKRYWQECQVQNEK